MFFTILKNKIEFLKHKKIFSRLKTVKKVTKTYDKKIIGKKYIYKNVGPTLDDDIFNINFFKINYNNHKNGIKNKKERKKMSKLISLTK